MTKTRSVIPYICLSVAFFACFRSALAQAPSIAITPASIDAKVKAGASYTQNFTLNNNTNERMKFHCSASDMWFDEQNQRLNGRAGTFPRSASLWIQFAPSEVVVEPHSSAVVKATVTIPPYASGSFYTVPVFEATPDKLLMAITDTNVSTASIGIRFRTLMMVTTEQGSEYNVEIITGQVSPPTTSQELELALDLRNRGTAHAKVRGAYAILDSSGKLEGRGAIDEKRFLPTQRNTIKAKWSGELRPGEHTCIVTLTYNRVGLDPISLVKEIPFTVK